MNFFKYSLFKISYDINIIYIFLKYCMYINTYKFIA